MPGRAVYIFSVKMVYKVVLNWRQGQFPLNRNPPYENAGSFNLLYKKQTPFRLSPNGVDIVNSVTVINPWHG